MCQSASCRLKDQLVCIRYPLFEGELKRLFIVHEQQSNVDDVDKLNDGCEIRSVVAINPTVLANIKTTIDLFHVLK